MANYPTSYATFRKQQEIEKDSTVRTRLYRFAYRYRLAKSFQAIKADGIGKTLVGYSAMMKLYLAYSAYDELVTVARDIKVLKISKVWQNHVVEGNLAARLRKSEKLKNYLINFSIDIGLQAALKDMYDGKTDNIAQVCGAIRHLFAHGDITPTPIGLNKAKERKLFFDLAEGLLAHCDKLFTKIVNPKIIVVKVKKPSKKIVKP